MDHPKLLISIRTDPRDIVAAARQFATGVASALGADEGDGDILVGPICTIMRGRAVQIMFARPAGALIAMNLNFGSLAVRTAAAGEQFRAAVIAALGRYGRVQAYESIRALLAAAREPAPQREVRPLLH